LEDNPLFCKPNNWDNIVAACINAKNAVGLDIAAIDVKVQSKDNPNFIILETNSAPALGEIGVNKYKELLNKYIYA
jgi:glutathione synthase/RimK-type ligase-like ATP-grasp enzyme